MSGNELSDILDPAVRGVPGVPAVSPAGVAEQGGQACNKAWVGHINFNFTLAMRLVECQTNDSIPQHFTFVQMQAKQKARIHLLQDITEV